VPGCVGVFGGGGGEGFWKAGVRERFLVVFFVSWVGAGGEGGPRWGAWVSGEVGGCWEGGPRFVSPGRGWVISGLLGGGGVCVVFGRSGGGLL